MTDQTSTPGAESMPEPGEITPLSDAVLRVLAPNPGLMTGAGTNTYIVGTDDILIIDPGPDIDSHRAAVVDAVGEREVRSILVTHHHVDHWPLAPKLGTHYGVRVLAHGPIGDFKPDQRFPAGGMQIVKGARLRSMHTPGHASDHLAFLFEEEDALFSGDHILAGTTTVIAPPDGNMAAYLKSLDLVRKQDLKRLYPGHGPVIDDPVPWIDYYISHRAEREEAIYEAVVAGVESIPEIVERVYTDVDEKLHPVARFSVLAHLEKLIDENKVTVPEDDYVAEQGFTAESGDAARPALPKQEPPLMEARFSPMTGA